MPEGEIEKGLGFDRPMIYSKPLPLPLMWDYEREGGGLKFGRPIIYIELIVFNSHARGRDIEGFKIWQTYDLY